MPNKSDLTMRAVPFNRPPKLVKTKSVARESRVVTVNIMV